MSSANLNATGARMSAAGAALLLAALWLPWYEITFPQAFRDALGKAGGATTTTGGTPAQGLGGAVNSIFAGLVAAIPDRIRADGWQAQRGGDIVLAVIVGLVLVLLTNGLGVLRIDDEGRGTALKVLGMVAVAIVGYHIVRRPFGDLPGFVEAPTVQYGIFAALAGAVLIGIGGHVLTQDEQRTRTVDASDLAPATFGPEPELTPLYQPPSAGTSVAPPGLG